MLAEMCHRFEQQGETDNLYHFLTTSAALRKVPVLLLIGAAHESHLTVEGWAGAVFVFEYKAFGVGLKLYASADYTGRRNVFGPVQDRAWLAATALRTLIEQGAHIAFAAFQTPFVPESILHRVLQSDEQGGTWSIWEREVPLYLRIESTFDATLLHVGKKTRINLRLYRRRAEADLGAVFVPDFRPTLAEFLAFNRIACFPIPENVAQARFAGHQTLKHPFMSAVRAADGRLLSVVGGWYRHDAAEIEWQLNRADLPEYSLATLMRSYFIEHAIGLGLKRLYMEGGTQQAIQNSFVRQSVADLTVMRSSVYVKLLQRFAQRVLPKDNYLRLLLGKSDLRWERW